MHNYNITLVGDTKTPANIGKRLQQLQGIRSKFSNETIINFRRNKSARKET